LHNPPATGDRQRIDEARRPASPEICVQVIPVGWASPSSKKQFAGDAEQDRQRRVAQQPPPVRFFRNCPENSPKQADCDQRNQTETEARQDIGHGIFDVIQRGRPTSAWRRNWGRGDPHGEELPAAGAGHLLALEARIVLVAAERNTGRADRAPEAPLSPRFSRAAAGRVNSREPRTSGAVVRRASRQHRSGRRCLPAMAGLSIRCLSACPPVGHFSSGTQPN
jgi:hypothetical protein